MRHSVALSLLVVLSSASAVFGQPASVPAVEPFVRNWTRAEAWHYFEPQPTNGTTLTGDPTTAHIGNRLVGGVRLRRGSVDSTVALQYVQFGGLPSDAIGPGALGTGALYFDHSGSSASHQ